MSRQRILALIEAALLCLVLLAGHRVRARIAEGWTFTGADGYAYMGAASELAENHRFGFRLPTWYPAQPKVTPLGYCRPPGYPLFLVAVAHPPVKNYEEYFSRVKPVERIIDLCTCLLVFFMARRIGGRLVAWPAFLASVFNPFLILYAAAVLTETLATFLTTVVLALLLLAIDRHTKDRRAELCMALAGAVAGLGVLVRIDFILITPCLAVPLLLRPPGQKEPPLRVRLRGLLLAGLAFLLLFGPWPVRNFIRFGHLHPFGAPCDIRGQAMEHTSFLPWAATWLEKELQLPNTAWCMHRPECVSTVDNFPAEAFDSPQEKQEAARLFALRQREGLSPRVDDGFRALARARARSHPLRTFVVLPIKRVFHMWVNENNQPLRGTSSLPWPAVMSKAGRAFLAISVVGDVLGLLGLLSLIALRRWREQRRVAVLFGAALAIRTGFFAFTTFVEARYLLELAPVMMILAGVAVAQLVHGLRGRRRQAA